MSDLELEDIAAAAGIAIVDAIHDGGDADCHRDSIVVSESDKTATKEESEKDAGDSNIVRMLEEEFEHRYTEEDPDYVKTVQNFATNSQPPCIKGYSSRRSRDFVPNRNQHQDYGRSGYQRRDYGGRGDYCDQRQRSRGYEDRRYEQNKPYRYDSRDDRGWRRDNSHR